MERSSFEDMRRLSRLCSPLQVGCAPPSRQTVLPTPGGQPGGLEEPGEDGVRRGGRCEEDQAHWTRLSVSHLGSNMFPPAGARALWTG